MVIWVFGSVYLCSVLADAVSSTQCLCRQWQCSSWQASTAPSWLLGGKRDTFVHFNWLCFFCNGSKLRPSYLPKAYHHPLAPPPTKHYLIHRENTSSSNNRAPHWAEGTHFSNTPAAHSCPSATCPSLPQSHSYIKQKEMEEKQIHAFFCHCRHDSCLNGLSSSPRITISSHRSFKETQTGCIMYPASCHWFLDWKTTTETTALLAAMNASREVIFLKWKARRFQGKNRMPDCAPQGGTE